MSRSLVVGLLLTPVLVAAPVPRDEAGRISRLYGTVHDPDKGTEFRSAGDTLRVSVPPEPRLLGPWCKVVSAPRVWREVGGDFTVTVRVTFPIRSPVPAKHEEVPESRAGGGIVIWTDAENFMTVTRDERATSGEEPGEFFRAEVCNEGTAGGYAEYSAPKGFGYLRAQRTGKKFQSSFSTDAKKWKPLCLHELAWGDRVKVGVVAENSFKAPFDVAFDGYAITFAKE
jgi:regulation of enolase protein 1 (concanavalin A-like superfamily)